jgi:hypothetical protein
LLLQRIACAIALTIGAINGATAQKATAPVIELVARGEIQIAPDGHVKDYQLKSDLAAAVAALVDGTVRGWHFEPVLVDGKAVIAKTTMTLYLHGEPTAGDSYSLSIASVNFGTLTRAKLDPPRYPNEAVRVRLGARVVPNLLIDADGKVVEAVAGQTSLDRRAKNESEAEAWRQLFEKVSIDAAKHWRYAPSEFVDGKPTSRRYAIAPLVFSIGRNESIAYVPGPIHPAPWAKTNATSKDEERFAQLSDGETASTDTHFHLKDDVVGKKL